MPIITIFDPPMCCSSGVCGPEPDQKLIDFANTITKLKEAGVNVERYVITQSPEKFKENPDVLKLIQEEQLKVLPIIKVDSRIVKKAAYPTLAECLSYIKEAN